MQPGALRVSTPIVPTRWVQASVLMVYENVLHVNLAAAAFSSSIVCDELKTANYTPITVTTSTVKGVSTLTRVESPTENGKHLHIVPYKDFVSTYVTDGNADVLAAAGFLECDKADDVVFPDTSQSDLLFGLTVAVRAGGPVSYDNAYCFEDDIAKSFGFGIISARKALCKFPYIYLDRDCSRRRPNSRGYVKPILRSYLLKDVLLELVASKAARSRSPETIEGHFRRLYDKAVETDVGEQASAEATVIVEPEPKPEPEPEVDDERTSAEPVDSVVVPPVREIINGSEYSKLVDFTIGALTNALTLSKHIHANYTQLSRGF